MDKIIPRPLSINLSAEQFRLSSDTTITVDPDSDELAAIGEYLAAQLRHATGFPLPVSPDPVVPQKGAILLTIDGQDATLGEEGYTLDVTPDNIQLGACRPAGLFHAIQTLRQMLPPAIESASPQTVSWSIPAGRVRDVPRFAWRGFMLDVARHFFKVEDVKRLIDLLAYYKLNVLHLHLTDDQGWRIMIQSWPQLAAYGGSTQVGGGAGGYYSQEQYADLAAYAQRQYITLVPEIDMPGHINAALASYPELNASGTAPALYTGMDVGFSSLCDRPVTYQFLDDVVRELAAITPGPYIHIGGDESRSTSLDDYLKFIAKMQAIIRAHGKLPIGWEEIGQASLLPGAMAQHWNTGRVERQYAALAADQGARIIMSSAEYTYLDGKYTPETPLGLHWAGYNEVQHAYLWDPTNDEPGVPLQNILGIEACLWTETVTNMQDIQFMVLPRLAGLAETGWSPVNHDWDEYRLRLASHAPRWKGMQVNYYPSSQVPWE